MMPRYVGLFQVAQIDSSIVPSWRHHYIKQIPRNEKKMLEMEMMV
jgi:hypothetical protein